MTTPELPPLHWVGAMQIDNASFQSLATEASAKARERILLARIEELEADRDSWKEQAESRVEDWAKEYERSKAAEARIAELEAENAALRETVEWNTSPADAARGNK